MANLTKYKAKICHTASGYLIHEGKILLVKHKLLGVWLPPGGHIDLDKNELPHQAAEREFWEETAVKVEAINHGFFPEVRTSQFIPTPICVNLHWINQDNYEHRVNNKKIKKKKISGRVCEQHLNSGYLVKATGGINYRQNIEETDGIAWFSPDELGDLETVAQIREEIIYAFKVWKNQDKMKV